MIFLNALGLFSLLLFCGLFIVGHFLLGLVMGPLRGLDLLLVCVANSICALLDLWFRGLGATGRGPLQYLLPGRGGHISFIPVWVLGLCIVSGAVMYSARPDRTAGRDGAGEAERQLRHPSSDNRPSATKRSSAENHSGQRSSTR
jgi:hypothetical protein